ncbi:hypothetical protein SDC9_140242 [bioreactor metagenome]|uniref:Uncharacterized protein n=1 Tax=bioreactor metagenome TaxID=1076179 RepID=A0A645DUS3_9ZZZZ
MAIIIFKHSDSFRNIRFQLLHQCSRLRFSDRPVVFVIQTGHIWNISKELLQVKINQGADYYSFPLDTFLVAIGQGYGIIHSIDNGISIIHLLVSPVPDCSYDDIAFVLEVMINIHYPIVTLLVAIQIIGIGRQMYCIS